MLIFLIPSMSNKSQAIQRMTPRLSYIFLLCSMGSDSLHMNGIFFSSILSDLGLTQCKADHAVFIGRWSTLPLSTITMPASGNPLILIVFTHVDNGLAICNSSSLYTWFIQKISKKVDFVYLDPITNTWYLGQCIVCDWPSRIIWVSQSDLVVNLLEDWGMMECKVSLVPLTHNLRNFPPCSPNACPNVGNVDMLGSSSRVVDSRLWRRIPKGLGLSLCAVPS
jgi:hypothetical protein